MKNTIFVINMIILFSCPTSAMYCPQTGRFLQRDPINEVEVVNLYEYAQDRPIVYVDYTGNGPSLPRPGEPWPPPGSIPNPTPIPRIDPTPPQSPDSPRFDPWLPESNCEEAREELEMILNVIEKWEKNKRSGNYIPVRNDCGDQAEALREALEAMGLRNWSATTGGRYRIVKCKENPFLYALKRKNARYSMYKPDCRIYYCKYDKMESIGCN
ncbi:MAG: hypothetical protein JXA82_12190 [Sedimentisphaerales bacterium]|nr:hypothetical protein [Sedimentisphaerales bacterium]